MKVAKINSTLDKCKNSKCFVHNISLDLTVTLGGRCYHHHPYFTDEEIEDKKKKKGVRNLPKATQLVNSRAWIQT